MDDQTGQAELQALFDMRRRVVAAFEDIATGVEAMASQIVLQSESIAARSDTEARPEDEAEIARLREALEEERVANAQLAERVRALHERGEGRAEAAESEAAALRQRLEAVQAGDEARAAEIDAVLSELIPLLEEAV